MFHNTKTDKMIARLTYLFRLHVLVAVKYKYSKSRVFITTATTGIY